MLFGGLKFRVFGSFGIGNILIVSAAHDMRKQATKDKVTVVKKLQQDTGLRCEATDDFGQCGVKLVAVHFELKKQSLSVFVHSFIDISC
jgi:hypothetical protein